jgi:Asp/Glu/hydantoin racemase
MIFINTKFDYETIFISQYNDPKVNTVLRAEDLPDLGLMQSSLKPFNMFGTKK